MPGKWIQKRRRDFFHREARREGYRSRAAYKLIQATQTYKIIKPGDAVLDLGSAPGGWLQAASKLVGPGKVLGVDIQPIQPLKEDNVHFIIGDVTDPELVNTLLETFNGKVDVVISDLSQNIIGVWEVDHARQIDLAQYALKISKLILKEGGIFFTKVFDGPYLKEFTSQVKTCFDVKNVKPKASRKESSELYILATKFHSNG